MKEVKSSNISHIGYDENTQTLKVRFHRGGEYHYSNVPKEEHEAFLNSKSIGSHFSKSIKNVYLFTKVNPENLQ